MGRYNLFLSIIVILCIAIFASCTGSEEPPVSSENASSLAEISSSAQDEAGEGEAEYYSDGDSKSFGNARYNFWITIPQEWRAFDRSGNGDGYFIECGNPDIDMRVFGGNYLPELEDTNKIAGEAFLFDSGVQGFADADDDTLTWSYISEVENNVISFYIDYSNDPAWFSEHEETVMTVAKSLRDGQRS